MARIALTALRARAKSCTRGANWKTASASF